MVPDPIVEGLAKGWKSIDGGAWANDATIEADVAIVGSGAGAGITAELMSRAGLKIVILEEGPLRSSSTFKLEERVANPTLYQEAGGRQTKDKAITILQGRCVGGTTVVNWTSSFRTPPPTTKVWRDRFGLTELTDDALAPWFAQAERRLNIAPWDVPPNENNGMLAKGLEKLGLPFKVIPRNVNGCWNIGYCGFGCPTNAKQSMLITTLATAWENGAAIYHRTRVERLLVENGKVIGAVCSAVGTNGDRLNSYRLTVKARHVVLAAGAIGSPAVLLRTAAPDPHRVLGKRTFLHPVDITLGRFADDIDPFAGAPQSVYSDHFIEPVPVDGPIGYKLEVAPLFPQISAVMLPFLGAAHAEAMTQLGKLQCNLALLRDGFHPQSEGGTVSLRADGSPLLDYPITGYVWDGLRRAMMTMAEIQFAAGAQAVLPLHIDARWSDSLAAVKAQIDGLRFEAVRCSVVSAHVMGGCGMAADPRQGVVDSYGRHHQLEGLTVIDGSVFPTSIGANPQLSIYGLSNRNAARLTATLTGKPAPELA